MKKTVKYVQTILLKFDKEHSYINTILKIFENLCLITDCSDFKMVFSIQFQTE